MAIFCYWKWFDGYYNISLLVVSKLSVSYAINMLYNQNIVVSRLQRFGGCVCVCVCFILVIFCSHHTITLKDFSLQKEVICYFVLKVNTPTFS